MILSYILFSCYSHLVHLIDEKNTPNFTHIQLNKCSRQVLVPAFRRILCCTTADTNILIPRTQEAGVPRASSPSRGVATARVGVGFVYRDETGRMRNTNPSPTSRQHHLRKKFLYTSYNCEGSEINEIKMGWICRSDWGDKCMDY
jgi:hypothetical protein